MVENCQLLCLLRRCKDLSQSLAWNVFWEAFKGMMSQKYTRYKYHYRVGRCNVFFPTTATGIYFLTGINGKCWGVCGGFLFVCLVGFFFLRLVRSFLCLFWVVFFVWFVIFFYSHYDEQDFLWLPAFWCSNK